MKVLIAPDSFKNSLSAQKAAQAIYKGAIRVYPAINGILVPLSDGGEGFTETLVENAHGTYLEVESHDALLRNITAKIGILPDQTAVIELAAAAGIELLSMDELNPLVTSTFGVGELIMAALNRNCHKIILGLGGSATNDAGMGMATALGFCFYDEKNQKIGGGGANLGKLHRIDVSKVDPRIYEAQILVACDVTNPLCGDFGASRVFGPQKGASPEQARFLDKQLEHYGKKLQDFCGENIANTPGAGAAGGTAATLKGLFKAKLVPGFELVKETSGLEEIIKSCDLVITGEGKIDSQTAMGKAPSALAQLAKKYNIPVVAFAGTLGNGYQELFSNGFSVITSIMDQSMSLEYALTNASSLLEHASETFFRNYKFGN